MSGLPDPKARSLERGERRYRRKVASPKRWQAIIDAKRGPCRVEGFVLNVVCMACNREPGCFACDLCSAIERAERSARGTHSPQLEFGYVQYHHLVARAQGGDDVEDNIAPLSVVGHERVTARDPIALRRLEASLTAAERAYVVGKLGEGGMERLFGV